jgi:folate-dependent phosphoribosylglycinamide formyltransferase PurN
MAKKPRLLILATGTKDGGGSGFRGLCDARIAGKLDADIIGVVCPFNYGGVRRHWEQVTKHKALANMLFVRSVGPRTETDYQMIFEQTKPDFIATSGWLDMVKGHNPSTTFNIHPALIPSQFAGPGMHGDNVHRAVKEAFDKGLITHTGVSMHFVMPGEYDSSDGLIFRKKIQIVAGDTVDSIARKVHEVEQAWQPIITSLVVTGKISWDGKNPGSMKGAIIDP